MDPNQIIVSKTFPSKKHVLLAISLGAVFLSILGSGIWYYLSVTPKYSANQKGKPNLQSPPPNITKNKLLPNVDLPISTNVSGVKSAVMKYIIETSVQSIKEYKNLPNQKDGRWITVALNLKFAPTFPLTDKTLIYFQDAITNKKTTARFTDLKETQPINLHLLYFVKKQQWEVLEIDILQNVEKRNQIKTASGSAQPKTSPLPRSSSAPATP